jgi:hypothetical protein
MKRILLVALLAAATPLTAQLPPEVAEGSRVRLLLVPERAVGGAEAQELRGTVVAVAGDTLTLQLHAGVSPVQVRMGWVEQMYLSLGRASAWEAAREGGARGVLIGAGIGAMVGAEVAGVTGEPPVRAILTRAAAYGFSLGATSALVRALSPGERWRRVSLGR